jgi:hypothetical protein
MIRRRRRTGDPPAVARPGGAGILRLYPASWRRRYEAEMLAVLEEIPIGFAARLDLIRGALDARLHSPTRLPAAAALVSGGLWTFAGAAIVAQPTPPDWPGYLLEALPFAILGTALAGFATIGCWARRSDGIGRAGTLAMFVSVIGHLGWVVALVAALLGYGYGPGTIAAQALAILGAVLVGLLLIRAGDQRIGSALVIPTAIMLFGWPLAWLAYGFGWTLVGVFLLTSPDSDETLPTRFA